jgi:hypothetical protein
MKQPFICFSMALIALFIWATPALAVEPVEIVHTEQVQVGAYSLKVGFSRWPLNADRSLDIVFMPAGGIENLSGTVTLISPNGEEEAIPLTRHPRQRSAWGLDVIALAEAGPWSMVFEIHGPQGQGIGRLAPLTLGERPGPDLTLSWLIGLLPLFGLIGLIVVAWLRIRPAQQPATYTWEW